MPLTTVSPGLLDSNAQYYGFKNRIINGDMRIDQRNNGASVTPANGGAAYIYTVDRWGAFSSQSSKYSVQQNAGSVTPPSGYTNYLGVTSLAATTVASGDIHVIKQAVEAFNISDLNLGTASALPFVVSFWVRSSLTGTFGGALTNAGPTYAYPFTFTVSSANTWEYKTVSVSAATAGTWATGNGAGLQLFFNLGTGSTYTGGTAGSWGANVIFAPSGTTNLISTNGATFYITGVQLEKGSTATSFDYRPYGTELQLCQRYYEYGSGHARLPTASGNTQTIDVPLSFHVTKRAAPTMTLSGQAYYNGNSGTVVSVTVDNFALRWTMAGSDNVTDFTSNYTASAEL